MKIIEIKGGKIISDGRLWSKVRRNFDLGNQILDVLYYTNKAFEPVSIIVSGKDETEQFVFEVRQKYENTNLSYLLNYCGIK